jgi:hypothetical protein
MEAPPQSTQMLLTRLCSQMKAPPQSLHPLLRRLYSQMEAPPQSLHWLLSRLYSQMETPAVLTPSPEPPLRADAAAPAVYALTLESAMRAFLPLLRRPGPLLPPLRLRLLPSPPLPACRFPLAPALAPLRAMPTLDLSPASAPTTAPSFTVSVLPLLRLALALVLNGLAFLGGLASLGGPRHSQVHKRHRRQPRGLAWRSVERTRHESRGRHRGALCPACQERAAADAGPQTTAEHAAVALYPHSSDQRSCFQRSSRDGASNEARASPRAPERRGEPGRDTWP